MVERNLNRHAARCTQHAMVCKEAAFFSSALNARSFGRDISSQSFETSGSDRFGEKK
jgi:hypothetical protein